MTGGRFTPGEAAALRRLIAQGRSGQTGRLNTTGRAATSPGIDVVHSMRPEVYVARTPTGGIPALEEGATSWLGTGTETHSGTGTEILEDDAPGSADCTTWRIDYEDEGHTSVLTPLDRGAQTVYNLSTTAVPGDAWVLIVRDKFGQWYVAQGGGGGGVDVCGVGHADLDTGTGTDQECPVEPTDTFLIRDPRLLKFSEDFVLSEQEDGQCEDATTGSGTGTEQNFGKTAQLMTRGLTADVTFEVNPEWCPGICDLVTTSVTFCIKRGRVTDVFFGPRGECP